MGCPNKGQRRHLSGRTLHGHCPVWHGRRGCHQFGYALNCFCSHFPSPTLTTYDLRSLSPIFPRIPLDSPRRAGVNLMRPAELCVLYVWVEAAVTIEIVRARELNFSTQVKNDSHSHSKHSEPCGVLLMVKRVSLLFLLISPCFAAGGWWGAKKKACTLDLWRIYTKILK